MKIIQKDTVIIEMSHDEFNAFDNMMRKIPHKANRAFNQQDLEIHRKYQFTPAIHSN